VPVRMRSAASAMVRKNSSSLMVGSSRLRCGKTHNRFVGVREVGRAQPGDDPVYLGDVLGERREIRLDQAQPGCVESLF
jgi:hypothetical protein